MAEPKTRPTGVAVDTFLDTLEDAKKQADARVLVALLQEHSGVAPQMWGPNIIGFGNRRGRTGDWFLVGFSPRKRHLVLYIMPGFTAYESLLTRLGKHTTGKSCLYINKLADVDLDVLGTLVAQSVTAQSARA